MMGSSPYFICVGPYRPLPLLSPVTFRLRVIFAKEEGYFRFDFRPEKGLALFARSLRLHVAFIHKAIIDSKRKSVIHVQYGAPHQKKQDIEIQVLGDSPRSIHRDVARLLAWMEEAKENKAEYVKNAETIQRRLEAYEKDCGASLSEIAESAHTGNVGMYFEDSLPFVFYHDRFFFWPEALQGLWAIGAFPTEEEMRLLEKLVTPKYDVDYALVFEDEEDYRRLLSACAEEGFEFPFHHVRAREGHLIVVVKFDDRSGIPSFGFPLPRDPQKKYEALRRALETHPYEVYAAEHIGEESPRFALLGHAYKTEK